MTVYFVERQLSQVDADDEEFERLRDAVNDAVADFEPDGIDLQGVIVVPTYSA